MEALDVGEATARARDGAALGALLKLCNDWRKPGAALQGQCVLVSRTKFEVDVGYNVQVIAAFKQMPTKSYGACHKQSVLSSVSYQSVFAFYSLSYKISLMCVSLSDMKTKKWSFSLEDYKRLSE